MDSRKRPVGEVADSSEAKRPREEEEASVSELTALDATACSAVAVSEPAVESASLTITLPGLDVEGADIADISAADPDAELSPFELNISGDIELELEGPQASSSLLGALDSHFNNPPSPIASHSDDDDDHDATSLEERMAAFIAKSEEEIAAFLHKDENLAEKPNKVDDEEQSPQLEEEAELSSKTEAEAAQSATADDDPEQSPQRKDDAAQSPQPNDSVEEAKKVDDADQRPQPKEKAEQSATADDDADQSPQREDDAEQSPQPEEAESASQSPADRMDVPSPNPKAEQSPQPEEEEMETESPMDVDSPQPSTSAALRQPTAECPIGRMINYARLRKEWLEEKPEREELKYKMGSSFLNEPVDKGNPLHRIFYDGFWFVSGSIVERLGADGRKVYCQLLNIFRASDDYYGSVVDLKPIDGFVNLPPQFVADKYFPVEPTERLYSLSALRWLRTAPRLPQYYNPARMETDFGNSLLDAQHQQELDQERANDKSLLPIDNLQRYSFP